jgi:hypothetical protein
MSGGTKIATRSKEVKEQLAAVSKMSPELREVYEEAREDRLAHAVAGLSYYRRLGRRVEEVTNNLEKYRAGAIDLLATALELSESQLYKTAAFFRLYSDAEFNLLCNVRTSTGDSLTWAHVLELLLVSDKTQRMRLQQQAAKNSWSAGELRQAIDEHLGTGNQRPGSGRPFVQPKSVLQGLKNFCAGTAEFKRRSEAVWDTVFENAASVPPDEVNGTMLTQAEQAARQANDLLTLANDRHQHAVAVRDRYREIMQAREGASGEGEAEDE